MRPRIRTFEYDSVQQQPRCLHIDSATFQLLGVRSHAQVTALCWPVPYATFRASRHGLMFPTPCALKQDLALRSCLELNNQKTIKNEGLPPKSMVWRDVQQFYDAPVDPRIRLGLVLGLVLMG